ncbi:hypothetical protein KD33_17420 [Clostridium sp. NCR]|nr:hypothetical protein KD33_17420 [Clostridium sp. NCR]OXX84810.1 hypothetical protein AVM15_02215 [Paraclostridium benzoelyticum]
MKEELRVVDVKNYEENGDMYTEETLELVEPEGRISTLSVKYRAGDDYLNVWFSGSGHGSNAWCSYQIATKPAGFPDSEYKYGWSTSRSKGDVARRFEKARVAYPVPGQYEKAMEYKFWKYIRNSSTQEKPTRTYQWVRTIRGTGSTN